MSYYSSPETWTPATWMSLARPDGPAAGFRAAFIDWWSPVSDYTLLAFFLWANDGWTADDGPPPVDIGTASALAAAVLAESCQSAAKDTPPRDRAEELPSIFTTSHLRSSRRLLDGYVHPPPFKLNPRWCESCLARFLAEVKDKLPSPKGLVWIQPPEEGSCTQHMAQLEEFLKQSNSSPVTVTTTAASSPPALAVDKKDIPRDGLLAAELALPLLPRGRAALALAAFVIALTRPDRFMFEDPSHARMLINPSEARQIDLSGGSGTPVPVVIAPEVQPGSHGDAPAGDAPQQGESVMQAGAPQAKPGAAGGKGTMFEQANGRPATAPESAPEDARARPAFPGSGDEMNSGPIGDDRPGSPFGSEPGSDERSGPADPVDDSNYADKSTVASPERPAPNADKTKLFLAVVQDLAGCIAAKGGRFSYGSSVLRAPGNVTVDGAPATVDRIDFLSKARAECNK